MFDNRIPCRGGAACPSWFPIASLSNRLVRRREFATCPRFPFSLSQKDLDGAEPERKSVRSSHQLAYHACSHEAAV